MGHGPEIIPGLFAAVRPALLEELQPGGDRRGEIVLVALAGDHDGAPGRGDGTHP